MIGRAGTALLAAAVLAACGGADGARTADGDCGSGFAWHGRTYAGLHLDAGAKLPARTGDTRTVPADCRPRGSRATMRVYVLRGVPPAVGLVARSGATLYVAGGTFPVVRDHPLHLAVYGSRRSPRLHCAGATIAAAGRARAPLPLGDQLVLGHRRFRLDVRTRLRLPRVGRIPHLAGGQRVHVRAVRCPHGTPPVVRSVAL